MQDIHEGRQQTADYYWGKTKDKVLLANVASNPEIFDKWQGKIYIFSTMIPDQGIKDEFDKVEKFTHYISSGGNAAGACMYVAKAIMGSSDIIYCGVDCCFSYDQHFHSYDTQYDNWKGKGIGETVRWPDIYGIPRKTWPSYMNFKLWFDYISMNTPGTWSSASTGIIGSYPEGNLRAFRFGTLRNLLEMYRISETIELAEMKVENGVPSKVVNEDGEILKKRVDLGDIFKDSKQPLEITLF